MALTIPELGLLSIKQCMHATAQCPFRTVVIRTAVALFSHRCRIALLAFAHLTFALLSHSHCWPFRTVGIRTQCWLRTGVVRTFVFRTVVEQAQCPSSTKAEQFLFQKSQTQTQTYLFRQDCRKSKVHYLSGLRSCEGGREQNWKLENLRRISKDRKRLKEK